MRRLETANTAVKDEMAQFAKAHAQVKVRALGLETQVAELVDDNGTLKERVSELEAKLRDRDASTGSIVVHSLRDEKSGEKVENAPRPIAMWVFLLHYPCAILILVVMLALQLPASLTPPRLNPPWASATVVRPLTASIVRTAMRTSHTETPSFGPYIGLRDPGRGRVWRPA